MYQIDEETYLLFVDFLVLCDAEVFHHLMVLAFDVHPPAIGDISDDEKECQRISYVGRYAQPPRGVMMMRSEAVRSFHKPSLLAPFTWNSYSPGGR